MTDAADGAYRVVIDGTGPRAGTVAGPPMSRADADAGRDRVAAIFARDIAAGEMEIGVLDADAYAQRVKQGRGGRGDG